MRNFQEKIEKTLKNSESSENLLLSRPEFTSLNDSIMIQNYSIIKCIVLENRYAKLLYTLAVAYKGMPKVFPSGTPQIELHIQEIEDPICIELSTSESELHPGSIIQALVYYNFENEPVLSLRNSRLINYHQINAEGHSSYILGILRSSQNPYIIDQVTTNLKLISEASNVDISGFLTFEGSSSCELEKFKASQNKKWSNEKVQEAKKMSAEKKQVALRLIQDAIVLEPKNVQAYLLRGNILFKMNKIQEAKSEFLRVIELDPMNDKANKMLEKIKYKTGEVTYEIKDKRLYNSGHEHKLIYSPR